jgi:Do/DeqQ family serine protease
MNQGIRRLFALAAVFFAMFVIVSALRIWRAGGFSEFFGGKKPAGEFRRESYTLPTKAPLDLGDVELLSRFNAEYAKLTSAVVPSVVSIDTAGVRTERLLDLTGRARIRTYPTQGQGSGVIVTKEGHIVTNHHVISGQKEIRVTCHNGKTYPATMVGEDTLLDIAVLKIDAPDATFEPLKFGDSAEVQVGQLVLAIGNPFGLGETVTQGIISAKERSLSDNQRDLFQTDAAINPGNSGGPLVNLRGEIIGINVAIYSRDNENPSFQGVGFSIPSNDVRDALLQILERGRMIRGFLGVQMRDLDPSMRSAINYPDGDGAAVLGVSPASPAEKSGLQPWDVVISCNGETIHTTTQLIGLVQHTKIGSEATLHVWRAGKTFDLKATITESGVAPPANATPKQGRTRDAAETLQVIGIEVRDSNIQERLSGTTGVLVTRVLPDALAAGQVQPGDQIIAVNQTHVSDANEFYLHLAAAAAVQPTSVNLIRNGSPLRVNLPSLPRQAPENSR